MPTIISKLRRQFTGWWAQPTLLIMADYRRWRVEGGSYFFTLVAHSRAPIFAHAVARDILGSKFRECQKEWPFKINAIVLLLNFNDLDETAIEMESQGGLCPPRIRI